MSATQSALDAMAASIGTAAAEKGAKLTPVPGEVPVPQTVEPAPGWNKADVDGILRSIDATEKSIVGLLNILRAEVRRGLPIEPDPEMVLDEGAALALARQVFGSEVAKIVVTPTETGAIITSFAEDFEAKSQAAQAATFRAPQGADAGLPAEQPGPDGWSCPTHGDEGVTSLVSRKGREYRACTLCKEFEK